MAISIPYLTPTITARDRTFFIRQLALLINSGVALSEALTLVGDQTDNPMLRRMVKVVTLDVQNGHPFSSALARYPDVFDVSQVAMIKSGEASGQLNLILTDMAEQLEGQLVFNSKVRTALLYPVFVLAVMIVVGVVLTTVIIPRLRSIFEDFAFDLPVSTRIVLYFSDFLINYWYIALILLIGGAVVIRNLLITPGGREVMLQLERRIPVIRTVITTSELVRFSRVLAMLLRSGVPIGDAIGIVAQSSGNSAWTRLLTLVRQEVEKGVPLSVALGRHPDFPKPLTEMIAVGEQTGQMDTTLKNMANFYEQQADASIKSLTALIEPVLLLVVAIGVGFLVVSVIMPIYSLAELQ